MEGKIFGIPLILIILSIIISVLTTFGVYSVINPLVKSQCTGRVSIVVKEATSSATIVPVVTVTPIITKGAVRVPQVVVTQSVQK